jgi:cytochrome b561
MQLRNSLNRYGAVAQSLHWIVVVLVVLQFASALIADDMPFGVAKALIMVRHKSIGVTILVLATLRLLWRLANPVPALPATLKPYERGLAHITHTLLYVCLFAMPITGWIMTAAKNFPFRWFGLFSWPMPIAPDKALGETMQTTHSALAVTLAAVVTLHILAALKHHFVLKDNVLKRMLPFTRT